MIFPGSSSKSPLDKLIQTITPKDACNFAKKHLHASSLWNVTLKQFKFESILNYYFKVLQSCLGAVQNTKLIKLNQFIVPMDPYPYAEKYLYTLSLWIISFKHFSIKALTLAIPSHNLRKKLHWIVTPMDVHPYAKKAQWLKLFLSCWNFKDLQIWLIETNLCMPDHY